MQFYPDDDDGNVLSELAATGIDMSLPLTIEFVVDVPDEPTAIRCDQVLRDAGYETRVEFDDGLPDPDDEFLDDDDEEETIAPFWTVFADVYMVPTYDEIVSIQEKIDRLVRPHGGTGDGWEVTVVEDSDDSEE